VYCAVLAVAAMTAGCNGSGDVRFVSLQAKEIDPPTTEVWQFPAQECYWWVDEAGDLNIALRCPKDNVFLGRFGHVDLDISFVLDKPPAGSGRNYRVTQRETRTLFVSAIQTLRLNSVSGIVGVTMKDDGTLRGSYRIWMLPQKTVDVFSLLPQDPGALLCFGTFRAVKNEERGKAIRTRCEAGGWVRGPRPTTRPATTQPTTTTAPGRGTFLPTSEPAGVELPTDE
jgi:hypothetical protein